MDAIFSPFITIIANLIVGLLMSKGIIDQSSRQQAYQLIDTCLAAALTAVLGIASMYYAHQTHKVNVLGKGTSISSNTSLPVTTQPSPTLTTGVVSTPLQTGLPLPQNNG